MRHLIIFSIIVLLPYHALSQYFFWEQLNIPPDGVHNGLTVDSDGSIYILHASEYNPQINGVYRSDDQGITWSLKSNGIIYSSPHLRSISFDSKTGYLFLGGQNTIYRSLDKGENWELLFQTVTIGVNFDVISIGKDSIILVGGEGIYGIMRSTDEGNTWTQVLNLGIDCFDNCRDIVFGPDGLIYASTHNYTCYYPGKIYKSIDNGITWELMLISDRPEALAFDNQGRLLRGEFGEGLYRYDIASNNWEHILTTAVTPMDILVTPDDKIFLALDHWPNPYLSGIMMSTDGGLSFEFINYNFEIPRSFKKFAVDSAGRLLAIGSFLHRSWDVVFTGIEEHKPEKDKVDCFRLSYTNPFKDVLEIKFDQEVLLPSYSLKITNLFGTSIYEKSNLYYHELKVNLPDLPSGCYILTLVFPETKNSYKLIH